MICVIVWPYCYALYYCNYCCKDSKSVSQSSNIYNTQHFNKPSPMSEEREEEKYQGICTEHAASLSCMCAPQSCDLLVFRGSSSISTMNEPKFHSPCLDDFDVLPIHAVGCSRPCSPIDLW